MKCLLLIIFALILVIFITCYLIYICHLPDSWAHPVRIKFSDFEKWYAIAPKKWYCYDWQVKKIMDPYDLDIYCIFGFIDSYRYMLWLNKEKEKEEKVKNNIKLAKVLSSVQEDIDNYIKEIDKETEKAKDDYEKIIREIKKSL